MLLRRLSQRLPSPPLRLAPRIASRGMAAASGGGGYGSGPYRGIKVPKPEPWQQNIATFYGCVLWLWLFWRCKQDGRVFLGLEHPWDHGHGDHGHDDGHAHGDSHGH